MINLSTNAFAKGTSVSIRLAADPIDLDHLSRMTFGDGDLQREVLTLFERQATLILGRMHDCQGSAPCLAALAHTLKGSARGIGAWDVAQASEGIEHAAAMLDNQGVTRSVQQLAGAIGEAKGRIAELLRSH